MIVRIVHMFFRPEEEAGFLDVFEKSAEKIRSFEGCMRLELWKNKSVKGGYTTYSLWEDEDSLNNYRQSTLFKSTWSATKKLFKDKPIAYSFEQTTFVLP